MDFRLIVVLVRLRNQVTGHAGIELWQSRQCFKIRAGDYVFSVNWAWIEREMSRLEERR